MTNLNLTTYCHEPTAIARSWPNTKGQTSHLEIRRCNTRDLAGKWRQPGKRLYLGSTSIARAENAWESVRTRGDFGKRTGCTWTTWGGKASMAYWPRIHLQATEPVGPPEWGRWTSTDPGSPRTTPWMNWRGIENNLCPAFLVITGLSCGIGEGANSQ